MKSIKLLTLLSLIFFCQFLDAQPVKKVLIEKFTSAYCGNCPRATLILEEMTASQENVIWLSHHANWVPDAMYLSDLDPMYYDFANSAPRASFDRVLFEGASKVAVTSNTWEQRLAQQLEAPAIVGISIDGNRDGNSLNFDIEVNFTDAPEAGDFRLTVFAVEDVVLGAGSGYDQSNYDNNNSSSPLYQLGNPIPNYEHKNVTRAVISDSWGTSNVLPDNPEVGTAYSYNYTYEVPQEFNFQNIRIVAVLNYYDENDLSKRYVLNANDAYAYSFVETSISAPETLTLRSYPNPFSKQTFIELNNLPQHVEVVAYSLAGKTIRPNYQIAHNGISIHSNQLRSGVYIYEVLTDEGVSLGRGKWIVQ